MSWKNHIHADASILVGKPVIIGTRISVEFILGLYKAGWSEPFDIFMKLIHDKIEIAGWFIVVERDAIRKRRLPKYP